MHYELADSHGGVLVFHVSCLDYLHRCAFPVLRVFPACHGVAISSGVISGWNPTIFICGG